MFAYVKPGGPTLPEVIAHAHELGFTISDVSVKETFCPALGFGGVNVKFAPTSTSSLSLTVIG